jgi:hypothetical protein
MTQTGSDETAATSHISVRESGYRQGSRAVTAEGKGQKIKVRLMGWEPGSTVIEGSSADYPVDTIIRDFPAAFPKGTRMRANHDSVCESGGDIRRIMAKTTSAPWAESDGMYANALVREGEPTDFIRQFADVIGTSISAAVEVEKTPLLDDEGNPRTDEDGKQVLVPRRSERGALVVERFLTMSEAPYNSVDFVEVPGADGAIVQLALESAKRVVEHSILREATGFAIDLAGKREKTPLGVAEGFTPGVTSASQGKEDNMEEKALGEVVDRLLEAKLAPVLAFVNESKAAKASDAQAQVDAEALSIAAEKAVTSYKAAVEKIDKAELLAPIAEGLKARAEKGEEITDSTITEAKKDSEALIEAARERIEGPAHSAGYAGRVAEGSVKTASEALPKGW